MATSSRSGELKSLAKLLVHARSSGVPLSEVEPRLIPTAIDEAYFVQDHMMQSLGEVGGWKIGASAPTAVPVFAPMPSEWMMASGATIPGAQSRLRGVEVEVAFLLGRHLPARATSYSLEEVTAAIESAHPVIELVESGLADPLSVAALLKFADLQINGGFVSGPSFKHWASIDWATETVSLLVDGELHASGTCSNSAGQDLLRLVLYLANEGKDRTGGLRKGQWITTGSWTGLTFCGTGSTARGRFTHFDEVSVTFS